MARHRIEELPAPAIKALRMPLHIVHVGDDLVSRVALSVKTQLFDVLSGLFGHQATDVRGVIDQAGALSSDRVSLRIARRNQHDRPESEDNPGLVRRHLTEMVIHWRFKLYPSLKPKCQNGKQPSVFFDLGRVSGMEPKFDISGG